MAHEEQVPGRSGTEEQALEASPRNAPAAPADPWSALRALTPARIGLGRSGAALPTAEVLRFGLAHARARDAVRSALDVDRLAADLAAAGLTSRRVQSAAPDRSTYLVRPDLGRRLRPEDAGMLDATAPCELCCVLADGLSAAAVQAHAVPVLSAWADLRSEAIGMRPPALAVVIALQGRVALGDEIGARLGARAVVVLIGERPGLSSPDSLGIYLTWSPRVGRTDAERNCLSNIRPEGMGYAEAARRLAWMLDEARRIGATGVALKDRSDEVEVGATTPASIVGPR
jgi:ethanolamine ammonia-lyase small subunit